MRAARKAGRLPLALVALHALQAPDLRCVSFRVHKQHTSSCSLVHVSIRACACRLKRLGSSEGWSCEAAECIACPVAVKCPARAEGARLRSKCLAACMLAQLATLRHLGKPLVARGGHVATLGASADTARRRTRHCAPAITPADAPARAPASAGQRTRSRGRWSRRSCCGRRASRPWRCAWRARCWRTRRAGRPARPAPRRSAPRCSASPASGWRRAGALPADARRAAGRHASLLKKGPGTLSPAHGVVCSASPVWKQCGYRHTCGSARRVYVLYHVAMGMHDRRWWRGARQVRGRLRGAGHDAGRGGRAGARRGLLRAGRPAPGRPAWRWAWGARRPAHRCAHRSSAGALHRQRPRRSAAACHLHWFRVTAGRCVNDRLALPCTPQSVYRVCWESRQVPQLCAPCT